jgi:hypothetical protein
MFWRKTVVGGEKEGEKKEGKPLSPLFSVCSQGARNNKIIQESPVGSGRHHELFLPTILSRESIKTSAQGVLRESSSHHFQKRKRRDRQTDRHTHTLSKEIE